MEIEYKSCTIAEKAEKEDGTLHIKFYACCFGNIDSYGDIIMPSACDDFLVGENEKRMKLCYQHNREEVIGIITKKTVDDHGLLIEADILPTTRGKDAMLLVKSGALNEFSIGYYADKYHYEKREGFEYDIRILDAITIREASIVTFAANPEALLVSAKHEDEKPTLAEILTRASVDELEAIKSKVDAERTKRLIENL